ncbi:hypothetical protein L218DRAFT_165041 [Marasmius fiardii PR-910]|nr:hypothetical protein L218DRAFT_165041 [Marasmius fiardii PR-910]
MDLPHLPRNKPPPLKTVHRYTVYDDRKDANYDRRDHRVKGSGMEVTGKSERVGKGMTRGTTLVGRGGGHYLHISVRSAIVRYLSNLYSRFVRSFLREANLTRIYLTVTTGRISRIDIHTYKWPLLIRNRSEALARAV